MAKTVVGSLNLIPSSASFVQTRLIFYVSLGNTTAVVTFAASIYILHNYWHARSQGGRHPAAAKPPLYIAVVNLINVDVFAPPMDAVKGGTSEVRPTTRIPTCTSL